MTEIDTRTELKKKKMGTLGWFMSFTKTSTGKSQCRVSVDKELGRSHDHYIHYVAASISYQFSCVFHTTAVCQSCNGSFICATI